MEETMASTESEVKALLDSQFEAMRRKDIDQLMHFILLTLFISTSYLRSNTSDLLHSGGDFWSGLITGGPQLAWKSAT